MSDDIAWSKVIQQAGSGTRTSGNGQVFPTCGDCGERLQTAALPCPVCRPDEGAE